CVQSDALAGQHGRQAACERHELPAHNIMGVGATTDAAQGERGGGHHKAPHFENMFLKHDALKKGEPSGSPKAYNMLR
ncbi:hypothetical protein ACW4FQ_30525, partial [Escherichia coli]